MFNSIVLDIIDDSYRFYFIVVLIQQYANPGIQTDYFVITFSRLQIWPNSEMNKPNWMVKFEHNSKWMAHIYFYLDERSHKFCGSHNLVVWYHIWLLSTVHIAHTGLYFHHTVHRIMAKCGVYLSSFRRINSIHILSYRPRMTTTCYFLIITHHISHWIFLNSWAKRLKECVLHTNTFKNTQIKWINSICAMNLIFICFSFKNKLLCISFSRMFLTIRKKPFACCTWSKRKRRLMINF